jgi:hypothetical protein
MYLSLKAGVLATLSLAFAPAVSQAQYSVQSFGLDVYVQDNPNSVDFNRDGVPDFLGFSQNLISGNGTYTYQNVSVGIPPQSTGDFNNDGKLDYVVGSGNYLYLYYGNGNGGFTPGPVATGEGGSQYVVADFNGDGRPDVASLSFLPASSTTGGGFDINLFLNNGNGFNSGKLIFHTTYPVNYEGAWPYQTPGITVALPTVDFTLGDFDADGHADLMLRTLRSSYNTPAPVPVTFIRALYGDGHGNFTVQTVTSGNNLDQVTVADMNNDGTSDIVAVNGDTSTIYYGHSNRNFTSASLATPGGVYLEPMLVDVSGDGLKDIVYVATCTDTETCPDVPSGETPIGITTLLQTSSQTFSSAGFQQVQDTFQGTFVGDYNRDGKLDLALYNGPQQQGYQSTSALYLLKNTRSIPALCPAPAGSGFHICSPSGTGSVASPVTFNFSASSLYPIRKMEVWVDGKKLSETYNSVGEQAFANPSLSLAAGKHTVSLFSGAYDGSVQKTTYNLTVK